ncbi:MAG TPA: gliding motility-associated ABC transporter substrate-binding protein GldG [Chitinophagaceae bacterium]
MKRSFEKILASKYGWLMLLLILFGINYLASVFHARLDLTKEKRYTLSKASKDLLRSLDDDVQVDVFLKGEFPSGFRKLANSTEEFLGLMKERNNSRFHYRFISPLDELPDGKLWGDSLVKMGAMNINLTVRKKAGQSSNIIFPVALLNYKGKQSLVNLFPGASREISQEELNTAEALMEYQFVNTLDKLTRTRKTGVAYGVGNGEPTDGRTYKLRTALKEDYDFRVLDLKAQARIPDSVGVLLIVKPSEQFTEEQKLKIDQFVMHGGKLLCFIDNLYAEMDSFALKPETIAYDRDLKLTDLFFRYGARINTDLVMDLRCDVNYLTVGGTIDKPQNEFLPWNYFPFVKSPNGKASIKIPGYIAAQFANSIDTIHVANVAKTPLLVTSPNSRIISTPALISLNENKIVPEDEKFKRDAIPVAMLLEGEFSSLYNNRLSKSQLDTLAATGISFKNSSEHNKMIIVGDGDMVLNDFIPELDQNGEINPNVPPKPLEMGWNKYTYMEYQNQGNYGKYFVPVANKDFLLNCVEYLVNNPAISETRNKDIVLRLLDSQKVKNQKTTWQFINIVLPVAAILLFGFIYQQIRKRKYAA